MQKIIVSLLVCCSIAELNGRKIESNKNKISLAQRVCEIKKQNLHTRKLSAESENKGFSTAPCIHIQSLSCDNGKMTILGKQTTQWKRKRKILQHVETIDTTFDFNHLSKPTLKKLLKNENVQLIYDAQTKSFSLKDLSHDATYSYRKYFPVTNGDINYHKGYSSNKVAQVRCPNICKKQEDYKEFHGVWHSDELKKISYCECCKE